MMAEVRETVLRAAMLVYALHVFGLMLGGSA